MLINVILLLILSIISYRLIFKKEYRFFYLSTSFVTIRIWLTIISAMFYASDRILLYELNFYSEYSENILLSLFFLSLFFLWYESMFSYIIKKNIKKYQLKIDKIKIPFFIKYLMLIVFIYLGISLFLFTEAYTIGSVGTISGMSKFNYFDYVPHPIVFKIFYSLNPLIILTLAYGFVIQNQLSKIKIILYKKSLFYTILFIGFIFHSLVYGYIQAKSHFILTYIMFFIVPIIFYNTIYKINIFKNFFKLFSFILILILFIIIIFYMHYGNLFFELLFKRLLLEGQFLFVTLRDFYNNTSSLSFLEHIPKNGEDSAIVQLMNKYLSNTKIKLYENTGWTMSGAMPGYNFLFYDFWIGIIFWFFNIFMMSFLFLKSLKSFLFGNVLISFLYIKMYWYILGYIALGENYLYRNNFWLFLVVLLSIYIIKALINQKVNFNEGKNHV